jgi:tRNA(adenine34) deaminase
MLLEPCQMCAGALYWSQISKIVFGASDESRGFQKWVRNSIQNCCKTRCLAEEASD